MHSAVILWLRKSPIRDRYKDTFITISVSIQILIKIGFFHTLDLEDDLQQFNEGPIRNQR